MDFQFRDSGNANERLQLTEKFESLGVAFAVRRCGGEELWIAAKGRRDRKRNGLGGVEEFEEEGGLEMPGAGMKRNKVWD